jgi:hypothetical protein
VVPAVVPAVEVTNPNYAQVGTANIPVDNATKLTFSIPIEISVSTPLKQPANPLEQPTTPVPAPTSPSAAAPASEKGTIGFQYAAARNNAPDAPGDQAAPAEPAPQ